MPEIIAVLSMQGTGTAHWQCNASSSSTDVMMRAPPQRPEFRDGFLQARRLQVCIEYQGHGLARGKDDRGAMAAASIIGEADIEVLILEADSDDNITPPLQPLYARLRKKGETR